MKKNMTTTRTASWQHDSMDLAEGLDNSNHPSYAQNRRFAKNMWSGHSNDGRLVQMDQQPNRKGNDGSCHHSGMGQSGHTPPTAALPSLPAQGSRRDGINRGAQVRTPGGTKTMPTCGRDTFNMGRGPTRGNQQ